METIVEDPKYFKTWTSSDIAVKCSLHDDLVITRITKLLIHLAAAQVEQFRDDDGRGTPNCSTAYRRNCHKTASP
jgi:hypothetical protein